MHFYQQDWLKLSLRQNYFQKTQPALFCLMSGNYVREMFKVNN